MVVEGLNPAIGSLSVDGPDIRTETANLALS